jgi:ribosome-binding factor A
VKPQRAERIGEAMRDELSEMLLREVKDPRIGFVTITRVEVARDLSVARVYISLREPDRADETLTGLQSAAAFLRGEVARRLGLRQAPALEFRVDRAVDASLAVQRILSQLKETSGRVDPAEDPPRD